MDFCKEFNARTSHITPETPIPVVLTVLPDRTFTFNIKTPPTAWLLKQAAGVEKGAGDKPPGRALLGEGDAAKEIGRVTLKHIYEVARIKQKDEHLKHIALESLAMSVIGTCRNIGASLPRFLSLLFLTLTVCAGIRVVP
jgi:large subunit ribosomal protein L11